MKMTGLLNIRQEPSYQELNLYFIGPLYRLNGRGGAAACILQFGYIQSTLETSLDPFLDTRGSRIVHAVTSKIILTYHYHQEKQFNRNVIIFSPSNVLKFKVKIFHLGVWSELKTLISVSQIQ